MKQVFFLSFNNPEADNEILDKINSEGIRAFSVFSNVSKPLRGLRRLMIENKMPFCNVWFFKWKNYIKNGDFVVCVASRYSHYILEWIHVKYPDCKLINYFWDKIEISGYPVRKSEAYENWSFDRNDCLKYGFKYNPQFYIESIPVEKKESVYDISFVGADREGNWTSRTEIVDNIYDLLDNMGFNIYFYYVSNDIDRHYKHLHRISEKEYHSIVGKSKTVLEIVQPGQEWMTLRPLLALSNEIKVITNNRLIENERFYSPDNIFIFGKDSIDRLENFINSEFKAIDSLNLKYYECQQWVKRFLNGGELL